MVVIDGGRPNFAPAGDDSTWVASHGELGVGKCAVVRGKHMEQEVGNGFKRQRVVGSARVRRGHQ